MKSSATSTHTLQCQDKCTVKFNENDHHCIHQHNVFCRAPMNITASIPTVY